MNQTKLDLINSAYSLLLKSGVTQQPSPNDLELALFRLEEMAWEWDSRGLSPTYNFEEEPDLNSPSGLESWYITAFYQNLAARLWPEFMNEDVSPQLFNLARNSLSNMSGRIGLNNLRTATYGQRMPIGTGQRWLQRFRHFYGAYAGCCN
jgi:hypothetical protein